MPTVREKINAAAATGIPIEALRARAKDLGITPDDIDLDYDEAKARGAARKAPPPVSAPVPVAAPPPPAKPTGYFDNAMSMIGFPPAPAPAKPIGSFGTGSVMSALGFPPPPDIVLDIGAQQLALAKRSQRLKPWDIDYYKDMRRAYSGPPDKELPAGVERVAPTPLSIARRGVRAVAGGIQGITGHSLVGKLTDIFSAQAESALDPFATYPEKRQHARDLETAWATPAHGWAMEFSGGRDENAALNVAQEAISNGEVRQAIKALTPQSQIDAYREMGTSRDERKVGDTGFPAQAAAVVGNSLTDLFHTVGGVTEAVNNLVGFTIEDKNKRGSSGAYEVGKGIVAMPGQAANLAVGLTSSENNSLTTHLFSTILLVLLPGYQALKGAGVGSLAAPTTRLVSHAVDTAIVSAQGKFPTQMAVVERTAGGLDAFRASLKQKLGDGLSVRDRRQSGELDININGPQAGASATRTAAERMGNQVKQGKVQMVEPDLAPVDVALRGQPPHGGPQQAARQARAAAVEIADKVARKREAESEAADIRQAAVEDEVGAVIREQGRTQADVERANAQQALHDAEVDHGIAVNNVKLVEADHNAALDTVEALRAKGAFAPVGALETAIGKSEVAAARIKDQMRKAAKAKTRVEEAQKQAEILGEKARAPLDDVERVQAGGETVSAGRQRAPVPEEKSGESMVRDALEEPPPQSKADAMISAKADEATAFKQEALAAGFDVRAMVPDKVQAVFARTAGKSVLEAATDTANHVVERYVGHGDPTTQLAGILKSFGVPESAVLPTAKWLLAEQELKRLGYIQERQGGVIRAPQTEWRHLEADPATGSLTEAATARANKAATDMIAETVDHDAKQGINELADMESREFVEEPPKSFVSTNSIFEQAIDDSYRAYEKSMLPEHRRTGEAAGFTTDKGFNAIPQVHQYYMQVGEVAKAMSRDRLASRYYRHLDEVTTQLLRDPRVRNNYIKLFTKKLESVGVVGKQMRDLRFKFAEELRNPNQWGVSGKNRFMDIKVNGEIVWDANDYRNGLAQMKPSLLRKVRADSLKQFGDDMGDAVHGLGVMNRLVEAAYGYYLKSDGSVDTAIYANIGAYATKMIQDVVREGHMEPIAHPFSGKDLAAQLEVEAKLADAPTAAKIRALGDRLSKMVAITEDSSLGKALPRWYAQMFRSTTLPDTLVNLHMPRDIAAAYASHFYMLSGAGPLGGIADFIHSLIQRSKTGPVAESLTSLFNNDISNAIGNQFARHDPMYAIKVIKAYGDTQAYLKGELDSPELHALFQTDIRSSTFVSAELRRNAVGKSLESMSDKVTSGIRRMSIDLKNLPEKPGIGLERIQGALREAYQEMGDMPFRVEQALFSMAELDTKAKLLEVGGKPLMVPSSAQRTLVVTRIGDNLLRIEDPFRRQSPKLEVEFGSPEWLEIRANYGNYIQAQRFFDYNKLGTVPKLLRTPVLAPLSGIFTWFWLAKRLVYELLIKGDSLETESPAVNAYQNRQSYKLAFSRALLTSVGNHIMATSGGSEDVNRAAAFDRTDNGTILRKATDPTYAYGRSLSSTLFIKPFMVWGQGVQRILQGLAFNAILEDPNKMRQLLAPTPADDAIEAAMPESQRRGRETSRKQLKMLVNGETFGLANFMQILGASGAPLVNTIWAVKTGNLTFEEAQRQLFAQFFGTTLERVKDVAYAGIGMATNSPYLLDKSTYGKPSNVQSLRSGVGGVDESEYTIWALNMLSGFGWKTINITGDENDVTGKKTAGSIAYLIKTMKEGFTKDAVAHANKRVGGAMVLARAHPGPEADKLVQDTTDARDNLEQIMKWYFKQLKMNLVDQWKLLP